MKAIILAAGKGSRLQPITDHLPKPLIEVGGKVLLDHIIDALPDAIDEVYIITRHLEHKIQAHILHHTYLNKFKGTIKTFTQMEGIGTMAALLTIKDLIQPGEKFLVMNGDDLHSKEDLEKYIQYPLALGLQKRIMPKYLASDWNEQGVLIQFRKQTEEEEKNGAYIATGTYLLDDRVFTFPPVKISDGEYGLPHTLIAHAEEFPMHVVQTTSWQPINSFEDLKEAKKRFV